MLQKTHQHRRRQPSDDEEKLFLEESREKNRFSADFPEYTAGAATDDEYTNIFKKRNM